MTTAPPAGSTLILMSWLKHASNWPSCKSKPGKINSSCSMKMKRSCGALPCLELAGGVKSSAIACLFTLCLAINLSIKSASNDKPGSNIAAGHALERACCSR